MDIKRTLSKILLATFALSLVPETSFAAGENHRSVYIHAQGENPSETVNSTTVYIGDETDLYFAVDDPNKGEYENGVHLQPGYDMNGYTVKFYFDPVYFDFAKDAKAPIDYKVPNRNLTTSESGSEDLGSGGLDVPTTIGYYEYRHGSGSTQIDGRSYKTAYLTVFFNGDYVPMKRDDQKWYNLCRLPLIPIKTGSSEVFIEVSGGQDTLELFAKNVSENLEDQTFSYDTVNGGRHRIIIKDKLKPAEPIPNPVPGSYTSTQFVTLSAEDDCEIYYSIDGENYILYTEPIEIEFSAEISCYAKRTSDGRESNHVKYSYIIIPDAPYLFDEDKNLIPNVYRKNSAFEVYVSDKAIFDNIDDTSEVYYTFSDEEWGNIGTDPETAWVKVRKNDPKIYIDKKHTVRLITKKIEELSEISVYYLCIRPEAVIADRESGIYTEKIDVTLTTPTPGAKIYYTINGGDPKTEGNEYLYPITLAYDTTVRAVAIYDEEYSEISSYYYIFDYHDDFGVDAFYPSGVYEGEVQVTLTPNDPNNKVKYSTDGGANWNFYDGVLLIDKDTDILAKAVDIYGNEGDIYSFTYKIKPLPPAFAPKTTQFTNAEQVTVYCVESLKENTERFKLYYTTDGSDPITSPTRQLAPESSDTAVIDINKYTVVFAAVLKDGVSWSSVVTHSYDIVTKKPVTPIPTLTPGNYEVTIDGEEEYYTGFMPVPAGTKIYYTVGHGGTFSPDPMIGMEGTYEYDGTPIAVEGNTIIKAVAVNVFGVKSDIGIFEYIVSPEAPKAAPSAVIGGNRLPVVPVTAVRGCIVSYDINGFENEFLCENGQFYINTATGGAYLDMECTVPLGKESTMTLYSPAVMDISAELKGVKSRENRYSYRIGSDPEDIAPPYADKITGTYPEINIDGENNMLIVKLYSLNKDDKIMYRVDDEWKEYTAGDVIKINKDTILQLRSEKNGKQSNVVSYVYNFKPLPPMITLPSGRYSKTPIPTTKLTYDERIPTDKKYSIFYRSNGDTSDVRYLGADREIDHTMSFKAYVLNEETGRVSQNTIHYYIIEADNLLTGSVYVANPYDVERISAAVLDKGAYADGIKLLTQNKGAQIHYYYTYDKIDGTTATTNNLIYDNAAPIMVNASMTKITINAWLEGENGRIENSDFTHTIDFVHLEVPKTSLGEEKTEYPKGTKYTLINDYPGDETILLYYTTDGSDPSNESNPDRILYKGEELELDKAVTVKTVYMSACGKCMECKNGN